MALKDPEARRAYQQAYNLRVLLATDNRAKSNHMPEEETQ